MAADDEDARRRREYLLDGRRVTVRDLLDHRLLAAGTRISYSRPQLDSVSFATVLEDGTIAVDGVRETSRSLSRSSSPS